MLEKISSFIHLSKEVIGSGKSKNAGYVNSHDGHANSVSLFSGAWTSKFPLEFGVESGGGQTPLFEDKRIRWAIQELGGCGGQQVRLFEVSHR